VRAGEPVVSRIKDSTMQPVRKRMDDPGSDLMGRDVKTMPVHTGCVTLKGFLRTLPWGKTVCCHKQGGRKERPGGLSIEETERI
jgi:hypothetical protein